MVSSIPPFRLTAVALNMSNVGRTGMGTIDITIDRWSTDERNALLTKQKQVVELENYASEPVRLNNVRIEKR